MPRRHGAYMHVAGGGREGYTKAPASLNPALLATTISVGHIDHGVRASSTEHGVPICFCKFFPMVRSPLSFLFPLFFAPNFLCKTSSPNSSMSCPSLWWCRSSVFPWAESYVIRKFVMVLCDSEQSSVMHIRWGLLI